EIIRPILRGRDIQKYDVEFSELYVIGTFPSMKLEIDNYPSVKEHLLSFGLERLEQSGNKHFINGNNISSRKKTGNKWFETQDQIGYWQDFKQPKIIYPEITKYINFYFDDNNHYYINNKCFILTGNHIEYLTAFLNSSLFKFCFLDNFPELLGGTRELRKMFFEKIPVIKIKNSDNQIFKEKIIKIQELKKDNKNTKSMEIEIDEIIFKMYNLTPEEIEKIGFIEI
ncbi:TaqI-like C-terminal specificity domain-containing protein, partial [Flavobacterium sp. LB3P21]|uniref:TaqI-like C-terminal specificity domain-containing protein n=1 Tax=Flavobacterium sp. LB3P21 TaxID=3401719 RepID=UPI003AAC39EC